MPGRDGTGPMGYGPLTGRGAGPCARRQAFGRGYRRFLNPDPIILSKEEQKKILEEELKEIEAERQEIEKKIKELRQ